jgi:hypothetical protein
LLKDKIELIRKFMDPKKCTCHGTCKGGATKITTGITHPPPIPSIAAQGEWSMVQILKLYWQFGDAGDCYAGRILAWLDHEDSSFEVLLLHFACGMENEHVAEAMRLSFGVILDAHDDIDWLLLLVLGSIVHHSKFLQGFKDSVPNHPFANIPILCCLHLLVDLKLLVTMKLSEHIPNPTGIPPHVKELALLKETLHACGETLETLKEIVPGLKVCLKESILEAAEQFAQNNDHVTSSCLEEICDSFKSKIFGELQTVTRLQGLHAGAGDLQANRVLPTPTTFSFQNILYGT